MGSRERKRAARQKRKTRSAERRSTQELADDAIADSVTTNGADSDPTALAESASERKNREAREALEPLEEGERPTVVTVAAAICTVLVVLSIIGYALWDTLNADEPRPDAIGVVAFIATVGAMAYGLWRARYWAVLGFQAALVLVIIATALGLISSLSLFLAIGNFLILAGAGVLFWFMIKAMARIQMPTPPGQR